MEQIDIIMALGGNVGVVAASEGASLPSWIDFLMTFILPLALFVMGLIFVFDYRDIVDRSVRAHHSSGPSDLRPPWRSDESCVRLKQIGKLVGVFFLVIGSFGIIDILVKIYHFIS